MTQTLGTNENNDIYIGSNGKLVLLTGQLAVEGGCATAAKAQLGEMIYAQNQGMPTMQTVFVGVANPASYEAYLRQNLSNVNGVVAVKSISIQISNNVLSYAAVIESQYGEEFTLNG